MSELTVHARPWMGKVECEKHGVHSEYMAFHAYEKGVLLCQRCYWDMLKANGVLEVTKVYHQTRQEVEGDE